MSLRPVGAADAPALAALHARAFDRPWSAADIGTLLAGPGAFALMAETEGFVLARVIADEAEILTLAVDPDRRRRGVGRALMDAAAVTARLAGAELLFLEVAEDNAAARALYGACGFEEIGRRPGYYAVAKANVSQHALVMRLALNS